MSGIGVDLLEDCPITWTATARARLPMSAALNVLCKLFADTAYLECKMLTK